MLNPIEGVTSEEAAAGTDYVGADARQPDQPPPALGCRCSPICFVDRARPGRRSRRATGSSSGRSRRAASPWSARAWNDPGARFDGFDAVVLRSNWDYHFEPEAFLAWLDALASGPGARFWNPPALVRWNLTKRYLLDLARAGVPIVPTVILEDRAAIELPALMAARGWRRAVVKPVIVAPPRTTTRLVRAATMAARWARDRRRARPPAGAGAALRRGDPRRAGEWSLVFIDADLTHAVLKRPAAGDFRVQPRLGGTSARAPPDRPSCAAGPPRLAALPVAPLYARIDGVETADGFLVMEVEVNEPGLFFPTRRPRPPRRFAEAILRRARAVCALPSTLTGAGAGQYDASRHERHRLARWRALALGLARRVPAG